MAKRKDEQYCGDLKRQKVSAFGFDALNDLPTSLTPPVKTPDYDTHKKPTEFSYRDFPSINKRKSAKSSDVVVLDDEELPLLKDHTPPPLPPPLIEDCTSTVSCTERGSTYVTNNRSYRTTNNSARQLSLRNTTNSIISNSTSINSNGSFEIPKCNIGRSSLPIKEPSVWIRRTTRSSTIGEVPMDPLIRRESFDSTHLKTSHFNPHAKKLKGEKKMNYLLSKASNKNCRQSICHNSSSSDEDFEPATANKSKRKNTSQLKQKARPEQKLSFYGGDKNKESLETTRPLKLKRKPLSRKSITPPQAGSSLDNPLCLDDEEIMEQDQPVLKPDEQVLKPDEQVLEPDEPVLKLVLEPDELVLEPDEPVSQPGELVLEPDEQVLEPDEQVLEPDEQLLKQDRPVSKDDKLASNQDQPVLEQDQQVLEQDELVFKQEFPIVPYKSKRYSTRSVTSSQVPSLTSPCLSTCDDWQNIDLMQYVSEIWIGYLSTSPVQVEVTCSGISLVIEYDSSTVKLDLIYKDIKCIDMSLSSSPCGLVIYLSVTAYKREACKVESKFKLNKFWSIDDLYILVLLNTKLDGITVVNMEKHFSEAKVQFGKIKSSEIQHLLQKRQEAKEKNFLKADQSPDKEDIIFETRPRTRSSINKSTAHYVSLLSPLPILVPSFPKDQVVLTYRPKQINTVLSITGFDLECLKDGEYLNDKIINFYLLYLWDSLESKGSDVHVFNSFFFSRLTDASKDSANTKTPERAHVRVKSWTKNTNIFDKTFTLVPVCHRAHWFLAVIVCPFAFMNEESSENKLYKPSIVILDSLLATKRQMGGHLKKYLTQEYFHKYKSTKNFDKLPIRHPTAPGQTNSYDCGVYLLTYSESLFECLKTSNPLPNGEQWAPDEKVFSKRQTILDLILSLANDSHDKEQSSITPAKNTSEKKTPEESTSDLTTSDLTTSKESTSLTISEESACDKAIPDKDISDKAIPDKNISDKAIPDKDISDKAIPDKDISDKTTTTSFLSTLSSNDDTDSSIIHSEHNTTIDNCTTNSLNEPQNPSHSINDDTAASNEIILPLNSPTKSLKSDPITDTCNDNNNNNNVDFSPDQLLVASPSCDHTSPEIIQCFENTTKSPSSSPFSHFSSYSLNLSSVISNSPIDSHDKINTIT